MGDLYRFPGGDDLPPDFETRVPDDLNVRRCYRHPTRETGVSCSQCGRPICYECMISAPVGFRCPACVKEQDARGSRARVITRGQTRSRWGAEAVGGAGGASVTKVLVIINVAVFVLSMFPALGRSIEQWGIMSAPIVILRHEYWRMFSSLFLHAGIVHILFNMWALWVVGGFIEAAVGRFKFLILFFVSGFAGSALVLLTLSPVPVVGASGAIFGIFGALAVYAYYNRSRDLRANAFLRQVMIILVINLVITLTIRGISWQAHIGGLVAGVAMMLAMMLAGRKDPRRPFGLADGLAVLGIVLALVAVTVGAW
jgi:membrane associated rhomboid family serine protease